MGQTYTWAGASNLHTYIRYQIRKANVKKFNNPYGGISIFFHFYYVVGWQSHPTS